MQDIRLLPIGGVLVVVRSPTKESTQGSIHGGVIMNENYAQIGIYVGPAAPTTPGAARVAVMSNGKLRILITSNFRAATDGDGLNVYPHIERGLKQLLIDQIATNVKDDLEVDPEEEVPTTVDAQLGKKTTSQATQDSEETQVQPAVEVIEGRGAKTCAAYCS